MDKILGARYVEGGRELPYIDCYGLVIEMRRCLGLSVPAEYTGVLISNGADDAAKDGLAALTKCDPRNGAIALCWKGKLLRHVAIVIDIAGELRVFDCNPKVNVTHCLIADFERKFTRVEYYT